MKPYLVAFILEEHVTTGIYQVVQVCEIIADNAIEAREKVKNRIDNAVVIAVSCLED